MDSNWDIGWILEHLYDSRGKDSTGYAQNDLFIGLRVNPNDTNGSEALLGLFQDLENQEEYVAKIEASSRIGSNWRFNVEAWAFNSHASDSVLHSISNDDFIQIAFNYYF